jgi:hypothetical protein
MNDADRKASDAVAKRAIWSDDRGAGNPSSLAVVRQPTTGSAVIGEVKNC